LLASDRKDDEVAPMRQILETEEHVSVPPMMYADPFYRITYLIEQEIRQFKWLEGEKGRALSWPEARAEWTKAHRKEYEKFLLETLSFSNLVPSPASLSPQQTVVRAGATLSMLPKRSKDAIRENRVGRGFIKDIALRLSLLQNLGGLNLLIKQPTFFELSIDPKARYWLFEPTK
jgi:hypothetical protein